MAKFERLGPEFPPIFTSMGMLIIDDIEYPRSWGKSDVRDVVGGAGTFAIVGSRMVVGPKFSRKVGGIIDKGWDFPSGVERELMLWNTRVVWRQDMRRLTSRGLNVYDEAGVRHFKYKTEKKAIEPEDIMGNRQLVDSRSIHIISSLDRCERIVTLLGQRHGQKHLQQQKRRGYMPIFIYEPLPDDCVGAHQDKLLEQILPQIDIFSPNLDEASRLAQLNTTPCDLDQIERLATFFHRYQQRPNSCTVLRCGKKGSFVITKDMARHFPAYHQGQDLVVDETGGGNLFCGAFVTALIISNHDWVFAAICASVVSGCIIESLGMPQLTIQGDLEAWNGISFKDRILKYLTQNPTLLADLTDKPDKHMIENYIE